MVVVMALAATLLAGCGHNGHDPLIGMHRSGLDIAFKGEKKGDATANGNGRLTFQPPSGLGIALPPFTAGFNRQFRLDQFNFEFKLPPNVSTLIGNCPRAPRGATAQDVAVGIIQDPPKEGIYLTHNTGKVDVRVGSPSNPETPSTVPQPAPGGIPVPAPPSGPTAPGVTTSFDFPPVAAYAVKDTGKQSTPNDPPAGILHPTDLVVRYSLAYPSASGGSTTYLYESRDTTTDAGVYLVQRIDKAKDSKGNLQTVHTFAPQPAVPIMKWGGTGTTWNTVGVDPNTGESLTVSGNVHGSSEVDVCGKVYDAFEVWSFERDVDPVAGTYTQSSFNDPNTYFIATQLGGLVLSQHVHSTCQCPQATTADVNGNKVPSVLPVEITLDYTMTLNSVTPLPLGLLPL